MGRKPLNKKRLLLEQKLEKAQEAYPTALFERNRIRLELKLHEAATKPYINVESKLEDSKAFQLDISLLLIALKKQLVINEANLQKAANALEKAKAAVDKLNH